MNTENRIYTPSRANCLRYLRHVYGELQWPQDLKFELCDLDAVYVIKVAGRPVARFGKAAFQSILADLELGPWVNGLPKEPCYCEIIWSDESRTSELVPRSQFTARTKDVGWCYQSRRLTKRQYEAALREVITRSSRLPITGQRK